MALNLLTIEEMIVVTQPMVDPQQSTRAALEQVPGLGPLMPHIDKAYQGLLVALEKGQVQSMAELSEALDEVDDRHDGLARAAYYALEANIHRSRALGDDGHALELERLQGFLFPHQLNVVKLSYRDEAGQAKLLSSQMTSEHEKLLASIPMPRSNLLETVRGWMSAGATLGELEEQRAHVNVPSRRRHVASARSQWIRAINTVRTIVELTDSQDPLVQEVLGRIYAAEISANPRAYSAREQDGATPNEDDTRPIVQPPDLA